MFDKGDGIAVSGEHHEGIAVCDICHATSCAPCRIGCGNAANCPQCNTHLPSEGGRGACGSGSCDI